MDGIATASIQPEIPTNTRQGFCRLHRMYVLLGGIVILSLADLVITLTHLQTTGMAEANPIARYIIGFTGSPFSLICFKALSVTICIALLYKVRRTVQGEVAAWCAILILSYMSVMWFHYSNLYDSTLDIHLAQAQLEKDIWVRFD